MTVRLSNLFENGFQPLLAEWKTQQRCAKEMSNGTPVKNTRSSGIQTKTIVKSESSSSNSSFIQTRPTRLNNGIAGKFLLF